MGITGAAHRIDGERTSAIGTGGSALTADKYDTDYSLSASITARKAPSGGATTTGGILFPTVLGTDEVTSTSVAQTGSDIIMPVGLHVPPITLHAGEGFKISQGSSVGITGALSVLVVFGVQDIVD